MNYQIIKIVGNYKFVIIWAELKVSWGLSLWLAFDVNVDVEFDDLSLLLLLASFLSGTRFPIINCYLIQLFENIAMCLITGPRAAGKT